MGLKRVVVSLAMTAGMVVATIVPASAATVYSHYYGPNGRYEGAFQWMDCDETGNYSWTYKCGGYEFDGRLRVMDWGTDGRPTRAWVHAYYNGSWHRYLAGWVPDGYSVNYVTGPMRTGVKVRIRVCVYKADYATRLACETRYTYNKFNT